MNIKINNWLQEAVETACEEHVRQKYLKEATDYGDSYPYCTSEADSYGLMVKISYGNYPKESVIHQEFFSPQEAFKIFLEHKDGI